MSQSIIVKTRGGPEHALAAIAGSSVMEIIRNHGLDEITASCGGECSCATCHIYVDPNYLSFLPPISDTEDELLKGSMNRRPSSRLACQIPFHRELGGMRIQIAPED